ncbi:hypothetical protein ACM66B_001376 [Microbotryomycetes sp. NB124-2]
MPRIQLVRSILLFCMLAVLACALPTSHHGSHPAARHLERRQDARPSIVINTRGGRDRTREAATERSSSTERRNRQSSTTAERSSFSTRASTETLSTVRSSSATTTTSTTRPLPFSSSTQSSSAVAASTSSTILVGASSAASSHPATSSSKPSQTSAAASTETSTAPKSFLQPGNKYFPLAVIMFIAVVFACCLSVIFIIKCCCHTRHFADPRDYPFGDSEKRHTESRENLVVPGSPDSSIEDVLDEKEYLPWHAVDQGMRMQPPTDDDTPLAVLAPQVRRHSAPNLTPSFILPPAPAMISSPISNHPAPPIDPRMLYTAPQAVAMQPRRSSLPSQPMPQPGAQPAPPSIIMSRPRSFSHPAPPPVPPKAVAPPPRQGLTPSERSRLGSYHLKYQPTRPSSLRYSVHSDDSDHDDDDEKSDNCHSASLEVPEPVRMAGPPPTLFERARRMGVARVRVLG